jgi:two-component system cell cycle sensor histidine kinase/response regulator CckA
VNVKQKVKKRVGKRTLQPLDSNNDPSAREREQVRYLTSVVEASGDAVITMDLDGKIIGWNARAAQLYGYEASEAIGQPVHFLAVLGEEANFAPTISILNSGEPTRGYATQRRAKDGHTLDVIFSICPIYDASGRRVAMSSIARDVTSERSMERLYREAQKMEVLGHLAAGAVHDFNNLLMIIHSCSEMIVLEPENFHAATKYAEQIRHAADQGGAIARRLLTFSRYRPQLAQTIDLNEELKEMIKMLPHLLRKNVETEFLPQRHTAIVRMDRVQFERMFINIAVNARDAMPNGGKLTIETNLVRLGEIASARHGVKIIPGSYVRLTISDTGIGMDLHTQARIFEPFYSTKKEEGTGLGLATVYGIVKQNGGFIWVYSELEKGTRFKIYLPATKQPVKKEAFPVKRTQSTIKKETILLADDQADERGILKEWLSACGYRVLSAADGAEANHISQEHKNRIDILLSDVFMPGVHGPDLARSILKLHPETRVIFMSGYPERVLARQDWDSQAVLLQKPFDIETLKQKIGLVLASKNPEGNS